MLPGTLVYVFAGSKLGEFRITAGLVAALTLLAIFPLIARWVAQRLKSRRVYARWAAARPARFDYNMVVIGAGSAGLVSAYIGAATRARVALVEENRMGGDCLNTGCVPSKALIRAATPARRYRTRARLRHRRRAHMPVDFAATMERVQRVIRAVEPHDSVERYTALGVDCIAGASAHHVTVDRRGDHGDRTARTDDAQHRDRRRGTASRAADPRTGRSGLPHLRHGLGSARAAATPAGARRRPDRLRAGAGLRSTRRRGDAGRNAAAHPDARRRRSERPGARKLRGRWRPCARRYIAPSALSSKAATKS